MYGLISTSLYNGVSMAFGCAQYSEVIAMDSKLFNCMRTITLLIAATCACVSLCYKANAKELSGSMSDCEYRAEARDALLSAALAGSKQEIARRRYDSAASTALIAYWHTLDHSQPGDVREFIGFLSRTLNCPVPPSWKRGLVRASIGEAGGNAEDLLLATKGIVDADSPHVISELTKVISLGDGYRFKCSPSVSFADNSSSLRLTRNESGVNVSMEWLTKRRFDNRLLFHLAQSQSAIVLATNEHATSYRVSKYNLDTNQQEWSKDVWALGMPQVVINGGSHSVTIVETDEAFLLFGVNGDCYVESFDKATGKCLARFATNDWKAE
jgi:hypothetical protein